MPYRNSFRSYANFRSCNPNAAAAETHPIVSANAPNVKANVNNKIMCVYPRVPSGFSRNARKAISPQSKRYEQTFYGQQCTRHRFPPGHLLVLTFRQLKVPLKA